MKIREKIWAIIPARAGSKKPKNKNIQKIGNKHLIYYTINDAIKSKIFEKILFLTDSRKYAKIAKYYGAEVPFIRSKSNASDNSTDNDLYLNMLKFFKKKKIQTPNYFVHLSPTVPFRANNIILKGINFFFENKKNNLYTMRSVNLISSNAYKSVRVINKKLCSIIKKDFDVNKLNYPRQFYEKTFKPNGLIDIISKKNLEVCKTTHGQNTLAFITDQVYIADIDSDVDLMWAKFLLQNDLIK